MGKQESVTQSLPGADVVQQWFGYWPEFHDAEVISLYLTRKGESVLRVYPYWPRKPATVEFIFEEVTDLELADFSCQNVINSLHVEAAVDQNKQTVFRLNLFPCYGLAGRIDAKRIRVNLLPGKSPDGVSAW